MAGIFDILSDLFATDQVGQGANAKRRREAAYNNNKGTDTSNIIDPAFIAKTQRADGIPAAPFATAANPKAEAARRQAAINAENERLNAEELARQKAVFLNPNNAKANSPALIGQFADNQNALNDFRQSESRRAADEAVNSPSPSQPAPQAPAANAGKGILDMIVSAIKPDGIQDSQANSPIPALLDHVSKIEDRNIGSPIVDSGFAGWLKNMIPQAPQSMADRTDPKNDPYVPTPQQAAPVADPRHWNRDDKMNAGAPVAQQPAATGLPENGPIPQDKRDIDGIFTSLSPEEAKQYGQFPAAPKLGEKPVPYVDPTQTSATPKSGLGSFFSSFDPSVIGPALAALDPRNSALSGALMDRIDSRRKEQTALTEKKANEDGLYQYLVSSGVSDAEARMMAQNPDVAQAWYTQKQKAANPGATEYGLTPQYLLKKDGTKLAVQVAKDGSGVIDASTGQKVDPTQIERWIDPAEMAGNKKTEVNQAGAQFALPDVNATVERVDARVADILSNPNLPAVVGPLDTITPDALKSSDSIQLRSWLDQIKGENFLTIRQKLKGQGAITDFESSRAESVNAIERAMNARDPEVLKRALTDFQTFVHKWAGIAEQQAGGDPTQTNSNPSPTQQAAPDPLGIR